MRAMGSWRVVGRGLLIAAALGSATSCGDGGGVRASSVDTDLAPLGESPALDFLGGHVSQEDITERRLSFAQVFALGDDRFSLVFNGLDGVGTRGEAGQTFSRLPHAGRFTGPNAQSCVACHDVPVEDGGGGVESTVLQNPSAPAPVPVESLNVRNTPHLFGIGALQRLAEEMTETLEGARQEAAREAMESGSVVEVALVSKGISFGRIRVAPDGTVDASGVEGVDRDLVVRPFGWKGTVASLRDFVRTAARNELGLEPTELAGVGVDADDDGVIDELSVGDVTALTIYNAAQPRPATRLELIERGILLPIRNERANAIRRGERLFEEIGCATCHVPSLPIDDPVFREPSRHPAYRDDSVPGLDTQRPVAFDLRSDGDGLRFETSAHGGAVVRLFGDLKRHDLGPALADAQPQASVPESVFITKELWGVGSDGPWLHDGRAATLTEAILLHGGEAVESRNRFSDLDPDGRIAIVEFLKNLVLFKPAEEGEEE